jgi:D-inositol-3-phosphate glycosyltransferase
MNGGLSAAVGGLVEALENEGIKNAVISFDAWRPLKPDAAPNPDDVMAFPKGESGAPLRLRVKKGEAQKEAETVVADFAPDLLFVHDALLWPLAKILSQPEGLPAAYVPHVLQREMENLRNLSASTHSGLSESKALEEAQGIFCLSRAVYGKLENALSKERLFFTPLGVFDSERARAACEGKGRATTLVHVGRFSDVKGTFDLLNMLKNFAPAKADWTLIVAGGLPAHPKGDRRQRRRLEAFLDDHPDLKSNVQLRGWLSSQELAGLWGSARILAHPSRFETFGQTLAEAQLFGVPAVAYATGALVERIQSGKNGLLVAPGDADGFVGALARLAYDDVLWRRLSRGAATAVRDGGLWHQVVAHWIGACEILTRAQS